MPRPNDIAGDQVELWMEHGPLLESLLNASPDHIYFKDRESRILKMNLAAARFAGLASPEDAVGKTDADFFGEEHARQAYDDEQHIIATGEPLYGKEEKENWLDGRVTWASTSKSAMRNDAGEIIGIIGISRDITERKRMEASLLQSEALFRTISESSPLGIFLTDENGNTIYANAAQQRICGRSVDEMLGRGWREAIHPEDRQRVLREWDEIKRTMKPFRSERRYVHRDGKIVWASLIATPILQKEGAEGVVRGHMGLVEDITEHKQMQEQILRSQRIESIGTLAGGIAHDLNNILAPIVLAADMITPRTEVERRMVDSVRQSARRAADLVKQLLSFARGVEGRRMEMNAAHLIRETEKIMRETLPKSIRITSSIASDLWRLVADPTQIQQILMNLCVNARDAMPAGGTLALEARNVEIGDQAAAGKLPAVQPGWYVLITVEDTGTGIPPEIIERIFDPFFTTKEIGQGTGLGLSTTLGIVKSHGGFIDVRSEPGKGTSFSVHLPAMTLPPTPIEEPEEAPPSRGRGELVLVVDDEPQVLAMARRLMEMNGYRVLAAADGKEAIEKFSRHRDEIDVVVTDMMMPVMDGAAMIQALTGIKPKVKIIATTGLAPDTEVAAAAEAGVSSFLPKPYTPKAMLDALRKALGEADKL